jgi:hypothetical protein
MVQDKADSPILTISFQFSNSANHISCCFELPYTAIVRVYTYIKGSAHSISPTA